MPGYEAPCEETEGNTSVSEVISLPASSSSQSEVSSIEINELNRPQPTPMFRALAVQPPDPPQPPGQDEILRRMPGYRKIVLPRELTLMDLLKRSSGVEADEDVLMLRTVTLKVIADQVGLTRLEVLTPVLRELVLDGSVLGSLRDIGTGLRHLRVLHVARCGLHTFDGVLGLSGLKELYAPSNRITEIVPLAVLPSLHTLDLTDNLICEPNRVWPLCVCKRLRVITLKGCPASKQPHYRSSVAAALPAVTHLDGEHIDSHESVGLNEDSNTEGSDGEDDEDNSDIEALKNMKNLQSPFQLRGGIRPATAEPEPSTSNITLPTRPNTATPTLLSPRDVNASVFGTPCSGSVLTSGEAVRGNIAHALRRNRSRPSSAASSASTPRDAFEIASRIVAAEIPCQPVGDEWSTFKDEIGLNIDINFDSINCNDPVDVIQRLEEIEQHSAHAGSWSTEPQHRTAYHKDMSFDDMVATARTSKDWLNYNINDVLEDVT